MLTRVAVEVIYCLASATRHTHHFAVKGAHVVSISLMSCSPPGPGAGAGITALLSSVKWAQHLLLRVVMRD